MDTETKELLKKLIDRVKYLEQKLDRIAAHVGVREPINPYDPAYDRDDDPYYCPPGW